MDRATGVTAGVVAVILLVTVLSGPLIGAVHFTQPNLAEPSGGNATFGAASLPDAADLSYEGSDGYRLLAPDGEIEIEDISGGDLSLTYRLVVPELNYSVGRTYVINGDFAGTKFLRIPSRPTDVSPADRS